MGLGKLFISLIARSLNLIIGLFGMYRQVNARQELCNTLTYKREVEIPNNETLKFHCPEPRVLPRIETLFSKEPATIEWLNDMHDGDILWDIGANIGIYSIYAGLNKNVKVLAFEPMIPNFTVLSDNIIENKMGDRIDAYLIAFSNSTNLGSFNLDSDMAGSSGHQLKLEQNTQPSVQHEIRKQAIMSMTMDHFVEQFKAPIPTHIKIDVDGIEAEIIRGAKNILQNKKLKSILIEINNEDSYIKKTIESAGFKLIQQERENHIFFKIE